MAAYPGALAVFAGFTATHTLAADNHAAQHNLEQGEILATQTKIGTGSSTPTSGTVLRGTGAGASAWGQVALTTDVTGTLPVANGGTGATSLTGLTLPSATLANPTISGTVPGGATYTSPILTTPTIADFTNAVHTHATNAQGGQLNGANAITDGTITPNELTASTGSSWAWQSYVPVWTNLTVTGSTVDAKFIEIGKTIFYRVSVVLGGGNAPSGSVTFTLPITSVTYPGSATTQPIGQVTFYDAGVKVWDGDAVWASTTTAGLRPWDASGSVLADGTVSSTVPFTFGNTDEIFVQGFYEAA